VKNLLTLEADPPVAQGSRTEMGLLVRHLDEAYRLARWLLRDETEADDAVQEAYLRAFRHFKSLRGADGRAWLLTIVRNRCYDRLKQGTAYRLRAFEEQAHARDRILNQESALLHREKTEEVRRALRICQRTFAKYCSFASSKKCLTARLLLSPTFRWERMSRLNRACHQLRQMVS
jgi:DNA-directed RNA polymerase specialized sigma24 family protein